MKWNVKMIFIAFLVTGLANSTSGIRSNWNSTDWYWKDIGLSDARIYSFGFTANVRVRWDF